MIFRNSIRRLAALAAASAITLQALWPLVSQARPQDPSVPMPVCTVDGITHYLDVKVGTPTPLDQRSAQHGEHCKLCVFGDGKDVAVVAPDYLPLLFKNSESKSPEAPQASFHQATLLPAQPRAPPKSS